MLYTPSTNKRSKRGLFGVVTSSGTSGPFMRRLSFPVQSGTKPSTMWRQIFLATKQNWAALGVNGAGNIPVNGVDPQSAWAIQAASYFGIMQAGLVVNGVQAMGRLVGCATPDAYYTMVQANRASLGLAPLPTPELVNQYLALASGTNNQAIDGWAVSLSGPSTVDPETPSIQVAVTFDEAPLPAAPTNFQASATGLACVTTQPTLFFDYYLGEATNVTAAVANGSSITYTVVANPYGNGIVGSLFTCAGFTPAGFNCSLALITAASGNNITVASNTPAGSASTLGTATFYPVIANLYTASINVSPTSATTSGAITLNFSFEDANGTQNGSITVNASTGSTQVAQPCPTFDFPNAMSCSTLYDSGYNVLGFSLSYSAVNMTSFPMTRNGVEVPGLWEITASDQYTDSYSPPDASTWSPILFSGPYLPTPAEVLAAWEKVWGNLADSGNISFQLSYLDPNTGASGPALSATAGWAKGTLKGFSRGAWTGPIYTFGTAPPDLAVTAPGSASSTFTLVGSGGYGGTITPSLKGSLIIPDGNNNLKKALPAGVTVSFSPATVTIPPGSTTPVSCTMTVTAASGAQAYSTAYDEGGGSDGQTARVSCTDSISSLSASLVLTVGGDVVYPPVSNYLSISNPWENPYAPSPGTVVIPIGLFNTSSDPIAAVMIADATDGTLTLTFDNVNPTVPAGTLASPGEAWVYLTIDIPASTDTYGIQISIEAQAGNNTCDAGAYLGGTEYPGLSIQPQGQTLNIGSPGSGQITYTVYNQTEQALTVTLTAPGSETGCTATFNNPTLNLPAASGGSPSSAQTTLTVTTASGMGTFAYQLTVTATVGAANAQSVVTVI